jgi:hypothetical protein
VPDRGLLPFVADLPLLDHHCHGVIRRDVDRHGFEALLTEAGDAYAATQPHAHDYPERDTDSADSLGGAPGGIAPCWSRRSAWRSAAGARRSSAWPRTPGPVSTWDVAPNWAMRR